MKRIGHIVIFLLLLVVAVPVWAGPQTVQTDSSDIKLRQPEAGLQKRYYEDKSYVYDRTIPPAKKTVLDKIMEWFSRKTQNTVSTQKGRDQSTSWLLIVAIGVLVLLIVFLLGANLRSIFFAGNKRREDKPEATISDMDIHGIDFARSIAEAEARKDYRSAVRLWFLSSLKFMTDKDMIFFRPDKTNFDYYTELRGTEHQPAFREISIVFDYTWYGEFPIDEAQYNQASSLFSKFNQRIQS